MPLFWKFARLPFNRGKFPQIPCFSLFFPFFEGISPYKMATGQNFKKVAGNFLETLIRIIHVKIWTSLTILRWAENFCVIKKGFSLEKGNFEGFWGENEWQRPNFWPGYICPHIFWKYSQKCCFGVNFRCFGPFLADLEHILGQKVEFSPPIL